MIRTYVEFPLWPNHTLEPPHVWTQWSYQFQLAIIAKDNLDLESLHGPEIPETQIPILEQATGSDSDTERANRENRNKNAMKQYESAMKQKRDETVRKSLYTEEPESQDFSNNFLRVLDFA